MAKYRANLDPSVILKSELETKSYWHRYKKNFYNQSTGELRSDFMLNAMSVQDWNVIQKAVAKGSMKFPQVMMYDSYEIVHDPTLVKDVNDLLIK